MTRKKILGLLLCVLVLCGCNQRNNTSTENVTLWVVTEISKTDGMNNQAEMIAKQFEEEHENVTVELEILPTEEEERQRYLKQLQTKIMAGKGPDIYLLPTGNMLTTDLPSNASQKRETLEYSIDPLFRDVTQAMYNGIFADISQYYDHDTELGTEALNQDVMNAGVIEGERYVLPIRYDMPVLLTASSVNESTGLGQTLINDGIKALVETALDKQDVKMAIGLRMPADTSLLPTLFDYKKGKILICEQDIADYMRLYQSWYEMAAIPSQNLVTEFEENYYRTLAESDEVPGLTEEQIREMFAIDFSLESYVSLMDHINFGTHWSENGFPLYSCSLSGALYQAAISKVTEKELKAQPLRTMDGSVVAEITYYGAVGAGSQNPELAYSFLREFLTEEYQWDILRPQTDRSEDTLFNLANEIQNEGLVEDSWPVRTKGATQYLWKNLQYQLYEDYNSFFAESRKLHKSLKGKNTVLTDQDMPILNYAIDEVRFPINQEYEETLEYALSLLNNEDGTPTDVDIDELAKSVYKNLWWYLAEG